MQRKQETIDELLYKLNQGVKGFMESDQYKSYLKCLSKFHNYSLNNTILIAMQKPDATLVAGYRTWKQLGRHVKAGEKGIKILAPAPFHTKVLVDETDPETGERLFHANGTPKKTEKVIEVAAFKPVSVFDISSTEGKELPLVSPELKGSVKGYETFREILTELSKVPIEFVEIENGAKGYYSHSENKICIQKGMSEMQTIKTMIHEQCHSILHTKEALHDVKKSRMQIETEAESVAYVVCNHFGLDTSDYSFPYLANWSSGKDLTELKASLDTIKKTASEMIRDVEKRLAIKDIKKQPITMRIEELQLMIDRMERENCAKALSKYAERTI